MKNEINENKALSQTSVMSSFLCKIGFHKLKYISNYRVASKLKCTKCGKKYIEANGELWRC